MSFTSFSRRSFLKSAAFGAAACAVPEFAAAAPVKAKVAVQLYSIRDYIKNNGLEKSLAEVAAIGYKGVEFAGYYGKNAAELKKILDDNGLVACGTHVGRGEFSPEKVKQTCEFNLGYGNKFICCPGGGNFPGKGENLDEFMKKLVEYYNKAAEDAGKLGCLIGLHNHQNEFKMKLSDGTTYWDYFFSNTSKAVQMEQDVGWTTTAGCDPCAQYTKYPHRSFALHAKENGQSNDGYEGILGQPGKGAKCVEWDRLFPVTDADGVQWYIVECERNASNLKSIIESFKFLQSKGRC